MQNYSEELKVIKHILSQAGQILLNWKQPLDIQWKGIINPVTMADKASETYIINELIKHFPKDNIISEESLNLSGESAKNKRRWYLDPLDGTVNFSRSIPRWCISLALVDAKNQLVLGVVYSPHSNELFSAIKEQGAYCNDIKISVSDVKELNKSVIASGFPYTFTNPSKTNLVEWSTLTPLALTVRCIGAAALDMCQVASGKIDIFWEQGLEYWDTAAGILICKEAGAIVSDLKGEVLDHPSTQVLIANANLHSKVVEQFNKIRNEVNIL
ncbi:inositol monophosphatase family protein [Psychrobacillus antarcticus]|uniref:inositol monophosphatase family protein n=1 Tax=Psychrobacillus antarcticus TaxID=2879115 RepID=UPI002407AFAA|nr:inositol monophosphatase family protein [Psychrobacillus antarcticus]